MPAWARKRRNWYYYDDAIVDCTSVHDSSCERREMSVHLRREVDTKESSLIRSLINKAGVTSLFALKERKYLNIIDGFVWFACGVR